MINLSFQSEEPAYALDGTKSSANGQPATNHQRSPPTAYSAANIVSEQPVESSKTKYRVTDCYDPYHYGNFENATSFGGIVAHIIVISFGPTLLSIPASFVQVGYVTGFVGTLVTVFLYAYCMRMVIASEYELCKRTRKPNMSYMEMVREAFDYGPPGIRWCAKYTELTIYVVFLCIWVGGNSILFLIASENLKYAYDYFFDVDEDVRVVMLCMVVPLVLLCWIPDLKLLVPVSIFTNVINGISICVILYYSSLDFPSLKERNSFGDVERIPLFVGLLLFTINATGIMIPLKNEMKRPKKFNRSFGVVSISYVAVSLMYSIFGFICYIKFGADAKNVVILNLPRTTFNCVIIGLYGIGNCCFYPIIGYVSFDITWNHILKDKFEKSNFKLVYEYVCRTLLAISSMVFACAVPNINIFLSLTGTVGTSIDSLIVPALVEILIYYKKGKYLLYFKNVCIIFLAAVLIVTGSKDCVDQLIESFKKS